MELSATLRPGQLSYVRHVGKKFCSDLNSLFRVGYDTMQVIEIIHSNVLGTSR